MSGIVFHKTSSPHYEKVSIWLAITIPWFTIAISWGKSLLQASMFQKSDLSMAVYNYSPIGSGSDRPTAQAFILLSALIWALIK